LRWVCGRLDDQYSDIVAKATVLVCTAASIADGRLRCRPGGTHSGVIVCELKPSMLATGFLFVLAAPGLGAPWIDLGSFIRLGSSFAGVLPVAAPLFVSVGNLAERGVAAADRHK
jgi:hypothetical protein